MKRLGLICHLRKEGQSKDYIDCKGESNSHGVSPVSFIKQFSSFKSAEFSMLNVHRVVTEKSVVDELIKYGIDAQN